jgi:hypothetical protein
LTLNAIEKLEDELEHKRTKPEQLLRLLANPAGNLRMQLDTPTPDDVVLPDAGNPLLAVAPGLATRLSDAVLDVGQSADEPDWVLVRGGTAS